MTRNERILELLALPDSAYKSLTELDRTIAFEFNCSEAAARAARLRLFSPRTKSEAPVKVVGDPDHKGDKCLMDEDEEQYIFVFKDGEPFDVPFPEFAGMIRKYVYKGGNMTQTAVCRWVAKEFGRKLTHDYFKRMLRTCDINKSSLPFAPHQLKNFEVKRAVKEWREGKEADIEVAYETTKNDYWEREYLRIKKEMLELRDATLKVEFEPATLPPARVRREPADHGEFRPIFIFSDWHVGSTHAYSGRDAADAAIQEMTELGYGTQAPILIFGGDMVDGPAGAMAPRKGQHKGQWVHYAAQVQEAQRQMHYAVQRVSEFYFDRKVDVIAVPGNHGRGTAQDKDDPWRIPESILYLWCQDATKDIADWTLLAQPEHKFVSYFDERTKTQILVYHGDNVPSDWRRIVWSHRDHRAKHFLLVHGHLHHPVSFEAIDVLSYQVGGLEYEDNFASENLGVGGRVSQQILLLDPVFGPRFPGQVML